MTLLSPQNDVLSLFQLTARRSLPPENKRVSLLGMLFILRTRARSLLRKQLLHPGNECTVLLV